MPLALHAHKTTAHSFVIRSFRRKFFAVHPLGLAPQPIARARIVSQPAVAGAVNKIFGAVNAARAIDAVQRGQRAYFAIGRIRGYHELIRKLRKRFFGCQQHFFRALPGDPVKIHGTPYFVGYAGFAHIGMPRSGAVKANAGFLRRVSAHMRTRIYQRYAEPLAGGSQRGGYTGGPRAGDDHVEMPHIDRFVALAAHICALAPYAFLFGRRREVEIIRYYERGKASEPSGSVLHADFMFAGGQLYVAGNVPVPAVTWQRAQLVRQPLAIYRQPESAGRGLGQPVLGAYPKAIAARGGHVYDRRCIRHRFSGQTDRHQVALTHFMRKLSFVRPAAVVFKLERILSSTLSCNHSSLCRIL